MDSNLSDNMESLADLLPEGLTEHAVDEIAKLVDSVITERVDSEVSELITKVNGFLRMKVDDIKNYALQELAQDEEFVRNGQIYENMKTMMSIELDQNDTNRAMSGLVDVNEEAQDTISTLTEEVEKLMGENEKLLSLTNIFKDKIQLLEQEKTELREETENLVESQQLPYESSEKAVMVSNSVDGPVAAEKEGVLNEFLTDEVMRFMPIAE